ncbi:MAG: hypothetical protein ACTSXT_13705 [Candidatus Helarchaeota archaeon]
MEISIRKINLTKSIINQMKFLQISKLSECKVLGYVRNIIKNHYEVFILKLEKEYFLLHKNYIFNDKEFICSRKGLSYYIKFKTEKEYLIFKNKYLEISKIAKHIFI